MTTAQHKTTRARKYEQVLDDRKFLLYLLETMMISRRFEEKLDELFRQKLIYGTTHLGIGEEAVGVGVTAALSVGDYLLATHRGHIPAIGKGCDLRGLMAEMLGKESGVCRGRGGSMHLADLNIGLIGTNGIVGAAAPIACGAALTIKRKKLDLVSVAFMGDGATNQGAVHEAMNLACAWDLPVIFCLVDNGYAMSTPLSRAVRETDLQKRAQGYGMPALKCDGNDVLKVYETAKKARALARESGPVLIVASTYRTSGHSKNDTNSYRSSEEIESWKRRDPILRYSKFLIENGFFTQEEIVGASEKAAAAVEDALEWAMACPEPDTASVFDGVYV